MLKNCKYIKNMFFWIFVVFHYFWIFLKNLLKRWVKNWVTTDIKGFENHVAYHLFQEFICSHSSVPHFTPSYNYFVTSIWVIYAWEAIVEISSKNWLAASEQFGSENRFDAGCVIWQQKPVHYRLLNLAAKTVLLLAP